MPVAAGTHEAVTIDGAALRYQHRPAAGTSRGNVVLLHPWFGCWQFWRHAVDALPEFATYAVDQYSLGDASNWRDFASPHGLARAITQMMDALGIERCTLIGNSMGGIAGQALAADQGERIEKLVLVGTGARTTGVKPDFRAKLDAWIAGGEDRPFTERLVDALLARRPEDPKDFETFVDMVANANKAFMGSVLTNAFALDLRPVLPLITASTIVIRGERDAARTPAHVEELLAGIPKSRAFEIPGGGHSPQVDSPQPFCKIVREFIRE